ncbi:hypothetical protein [Planobispora takensis]|uniref:DUF1453 domain-containing protein n=1 Tax=Planobispora takensis TaxID=1367882 RepID=A0A8J3WSG0_9ACTN|nr:hypothetical protein [Planobispora takensis]GIH99227.1 hypothetical protein Pta02_12360 [Planobispora takensis]
MSTWWIVIVAVLVVGVIVKRFLGEPLNARDLFVPPVVLVGIGVYGLVEGGPLTGADITWIAAGSAAGLALGALRGLTPRLSVRDGVLWQRYTGWTVGAWVLSVAVNAGVGALAALAGAHPQARPMTLSIGVSLLGEVITLGRRALATGTPFAPERASFPRRLPR